MPALAAEHKWTFSYNSTTFKLHKCGEDTQRIFCTRHQGREHVLPSDSFFSRIQSWFSGSFHGRYLAYILAEIGKYHPALIQELVCTTCKIDKKSLRRPRFVPEFAFEGKVGYRRADLAVFAGDADDEPAVLIEIKYKDKLTPGDEVKPAQLDDYCHWREAGEGRHFLVLSREMLRIPTVPTLSWTQAARILRGHAKGSDLAAALIEHLEEEGIVMQNVDLKSLIGFLKRLLCTANGSGVQVGNLEGPQEFSRLLRNMKLVSARFNGDFKAAWKAAGTKHDKPADPAGTKDASIDFEVSPFLAPSMKPENIRTSDGGLNPQARNGGTVEVYARHSLGSGKGWLRIGYGFRIEVTKTMGAEKAHHPKAHLFAWAVNDELLKADNPYSQVKLSTIELISSKAEDSVDKVDVLASKQLLNVLQDLLSTSKTLTAKQKMAVRMIIDSIRKKLKPVLQN